MAYNFSSIKARLTNPSGRHDTESGTLWTSPWQWRDTDGVYVGHNGEAWLYRKVPINPLVWEDPAVRLARGQTLELLLRELGGLSSDPALGVNMLADEREIHILSVTWEELGSPAEEISPDLTSFQAACLDFLLPRKVLALGVKLKSGSAPSLRKKSLKDQIKDLGERALGEEVPSRSNWEADYQRVDAIMRRHNATTLDRVELSQIESWFNRGRGPDTLVQITKDSIVIDDYDRIELGVVRSFNNQIMQAPNAQWILDATSHPQGPSAISVRGQLQTANAARARARSGLRRRRAQMEEEMATGDIERIEDTMSYQQSQQVEQFIALNQEPLVTKTSIIMAARRTPDAEETYMDELSNLHGIEVAPLVMRQLEALDECLPCSSKRVNPFLQDVTISMLAYCGLQGWSNLGDGKGVLLGLTDPDYTACYLDLLGAPAANKPPALGIFGDPGGGKSQPLDAAVLTPTGWSTMGELEVGSWVVAVDGTATRVAAVYPQGDRPIYRLTFEDGASVEADQEHLWRVMPFDNPVASAASANMSTQELLDAGLSDPATRWQIPVVSPVEYPSAPLAVDPYHLGALLASNPQTAPLTEPDLDQARRELGGCTDTSPEPFVPRSYLHASVAQRTSLLQGLLDTAGAPSEDAEAHFITHSSRLADDVGELVESLGGTIHRDTIHRDTDHRDTDHQETQHRVMPAHTLAIRLPASVVPFRLVDKQATWVSVDRPQPVRVLESIEYVGTKEARCILVEHPEHLYVTDHHIVTHNTFLCQLIATQATLAGHQVIFINPKAGDSLSSFAEMPGVDGTVVKMTQLESEGGYFDPFYYAEPTMAAEIAANFILGVLGNTGVAGGGFTGSQELRLSSGLRRGAAAGARCVGEALEYVDDPDVVRMVKEQVESSTLFGLGVGLVAKERYQSAKGLTLIEFDRKLDFPERGKASNNYSRSERIALAAMRLVTRAALEILMTSGGGVMVVDEAWTFLSHSEGLAALQQIGREGRSLNILPVFATQRVDDLIREGVNMESYISRVVVMELREERDAVAALQLCGLEPTAERISWLRQAGPKAGNSVRPFRPAMGIHRDLQDRHAALYIGPVPPDVVEAFTTNPEERRARDDAKAQRAAEAEATFSHRPMLDIDQDLDDIEVLEPGLGDLFEDPSPGP